jgi:hypothetical protein
VVFVSGVCGGREERTWLTEGGAAGFFVSNMGSIVVFVLPSCAFWDCAFDAR